MLQLMNCGELPKSREGSNAMQKTVADEQTALTKFEKKVTDDPDFNAAERVILRKFIAAFRFMLTLGRVGKWIIAALAAVAMALGSLKVIMEAVKTLWQNG
jgi:hypothetical protein